LAAYATLKVLSSSLSKEQKIVSRSSTISHIMLPDTYPECRFCLENGLLADMPLGGNQAFDMLGSIDPD
jgi:hypothetical protein